MKRHKIIIIIISSVVLTLVLHGSVVITLFYKITYDPFDIAAREYIFSHSGIIEERGMIRHVLRNLTNKKVVEKNNAKIAYSLTFTDGREIRIYVFFELIDNEWKALHYEEIKKG